MKKTEEGETEVIVNGTPDLTKIPEEIFELFIAELTEAIISRKDIIDETKKIRNKSAYYSFNLLSPNYSTKVYKK